MINIQISVALEGESVSWLAGKLSPNFFFFEGRGGLVKAVKRHLENDVVNQRQMCVFIKIN